MGPTGVAIEYDATVAIGSYKEDRAAIEAIILALSAICRMLVLDRAFGTRYFRDVPVLKTIVIGAKQE
jgi:xanthine/uracil permease